MPLHGYQLMDSLNHPKPNLVPCVVQWIDQVQKH